MGIRRRRNPIKHSAEARAALRAAGHRTARYTSPHLVSVIDVNEEAGLFFLAFNRDTRKQFIPMQNALSSKDAMREYVQHNGSAHFAVPPGVRPGGYWGDGLFT